MPCCFSPELIYAAAIFRGADAATPFADERHHLFFFTTLGYAEFKSCMMMILRLMMPPSPRRYAF